MQNMMFNWGRGQFDVGGWPQGMFYGNVSYGPAGANDTESFTAADGEALQSIASHEWTEHQTHPVDWAPGFLKSAKTSFTLPISSENLYFLSKGRYHTGIFKVKHAEQDDHPTEDVRVDIRVAYHSTRALARATVRRLQRGGNEDGIGIYTPTSTRWVPNEEMLRFEVVFTLPPAEPGARLHVRKLTTNTNCFEHKIDSEHFWESVWFDKVEFQTANAPIRVKSITLIKGAFTSSNGEIEGHFNASASLVLCTSNAPIRSTATLSYLEGRATSLDMSTSNGKIDTKLVLAAHDRTGGHFDVKAQTSNDKVEVTYCDMPLQTRLNSVVSTSNGHVVVDMHPSYEGSFSVTTSNGKATVEDRHPRHPMPNKSTWRRVVDQTNCFGMMVNGKVYWKENGKESARSTCNVVTSNAGATLKL